METRSRSIIKAMTWRLTALSITVAVVWLLVRRVEVAASIGLADTCVKVGAYYLHERIWVRSRFGRGDRPEYEI